MKYYYMLWLTWTLKTLYEINPKFKRPHITSFYLSKMSKINKFIETEITLVVARGCRQKEIRTGC